MLILSQPQLVIDDVQGEAMVNNDAERIADEPGQPGRRAVISGAGIAGLATALRLTQSGWQVLVIERAPVRRAGGYLINLHGGGYDAAERLGILPQLKERDIGLFTSILVRTDGSRKFTVSPDVAEAAVGLRMLSASRGDLEEVLFDAVADRAEIRFGTVIQGVSQLADGVEITFQDGSQEHADLLVGADGLHSGVRKIVFGPEPDVRVDLGHVVAAFPLDGLPEDVPEKAGTTFIGPGRTAAVMNLGPDRSSAFFTYRCPEPEAEVARGPVDALSSAFGDLAGGVPQVLSHLAEDPSGAYFDTVSQIKMDRWSEGRVVLVGDAAWCVTVFAGHGAGLALSGADQLGASIDAIDDIPSALANWESKLRPETLKRQAQARLGMRQFAPPTQRHVVMNDLMIRAMQLPGLRTLVRRNIQKANQ